jgi:hypothetical protein
MPADRTQKILDTFFLHFVTKKHSNRRKTFVLCINVHVTSSSFEKAYREVTMPADRTQKFSMYFSSLCYEKILELTKGIPKFRKIPTGYFNVIFIGF